MRRVRRVALAGLTICLLLGIAPVAGVAQPTPTPAAAPTPTTTTVATRTSTVTASASPTNAASMPNAAAGDRAQHAKDAADHLVTSLSASIANESGRLADLSATASLAEQRFLMQQVDEAAAQAAEVAAELRLTTARAAYVSAHQALVAIAVSSYQSDGGPGSITTSSVAALLTVHDPGQVLSDATEQHILGDHQATVVAQMAVAVGVLRTADRTQQAALSAVSSQTARLEDIRQQAEVALAASHVTLSQLQANLAKAKTGQKEADTVLSTFLAGWSSADPTRARALNKRYAGVGPAKPAPVSAYWTAAMGRDGREPGDSLPRHRLRVGRRQRHRPDRRRLRRGRRRE